MIQNESDIIKKFAENVSKKIAKSTISFLTASKATLSGDDSDLDNVWEEVCMQVQYEHSFFWEAYDETVRSLVQGYLTDLAEHEMYAIWCQTEAYWDWSDDHDNGDGTNILPPVDDESVVSYIVEEYVYREAADFSNDNIESFIERQ